MASITSIGAADTLRSFLLDEVHRVLDDRATTDAIEDTPVRLGILISGRGSNCAAIAQAIADGRLKGCEIAVVICNVTGAPGIEVARKFGMPVVTLEGRGREQRDHEEALLALLRKYRVEMVCLAGYRRVLSARFVRNWKGRMLNSHPSLLPSFPSFNATQQALEYGVRIAGCTVHFVDENLDAGPIILQATVAVEDADTADSLSEKILREEHRIYSEAVKLILSEHFKIEGRRVVRLQSQPGHS